jgi:type II secretory pathway pseudopilin PulG
VKIRNTAGFALIDLLFVCAIIGIISAIALPRLVMAKQSAGAASAIGSLRTINSGELTFALTCGGGFYAPSLTALGTPAPGSQAAYISPNLSIADTISRSGYVIQLSTQPFAGAPASCNGLAVGATGQGFKAGADAIDSTNFRFFSTNASGQLYEHTSTLFATTPEFGEPPAGHLLQ